MITLNEFTINLETKTFCGESKWPRPANHEKRCQSAISTGKRPAVVNNEPHPPAHHWQHETDISIGHQLSWPLN